MDFHQVKAASIYFLYNGRLKINHPVCNSILTHQNVRIEYPAIPSNVPIILPTRICSIFHSREIRNFQFTHYVHNGNLSKTYTRIHSARSNCLYIRSNRNVIELGIYRASVQRQRVAIYPWSAESLWEIV